MEGSSAMPDNPHNNAQWHQSTLLWGALSVAITVILTVVAAMVKDFRWLLIVAFPFCCVAIWEIFKAIKSSRIRWVLIVISSLIAAAGLAWLYVALRPSITAHIESQKTQEEQKTKTSTLAPSPAPTDTAKATPTRTPRPRQTPANATDIERLRADAKSFINRFYLSFSAMRDDKDWWERNSKNGYAIADHRVDEFSKEYNNNLRAPAHNIRESLMGHIQKLPNYGRHDVTVLWKEPLTSDGRVHPLSIEMQICDLVLLLNEMEKENSLALSCADIKSKTSCGTMLEDTAPYPQATPTPSVPTIGSNSVVSIGQQGGITAGQINIGTLGWRTLQSSEMEQVEAWLKEFSGQQFIIRVNNPTSDRLDLAEQLAKAFKKAGWVGIIHTPTVFYPSNTTEFPHGIELRVKELTPAAEKLGQIFVTLFGRSNSHGVKSEQYQKDVIEISIEPLKKPE